MLGNSEFFDICMCMPACMCVFVCIWFSECVAGSNMNKRANVVLLCVSLSWKQVFYSFTSYFSTQINQFDPVFVVSHTVR